MNETLQTFKIDRGIGQHNSNDYFAVLGLPVTADASQIRKRYLSIARNLHPDVSGGSPEERHRACQYLAKLVSPAYNMLMQDRERHEYSALLKAIAKRLVKRELKMTPKSEIAKRLLHSPSELHYLESVEEIAKLQYKSLDKVLEYTAQLSELNLIYIMYQEGFHPSLFEAAQGSSNNREPHPVASQARPSTRQLSARDSQKGDISERSPQRVQNQLLLAEEYISKSQWNMALAELRAALQLDRANSKCHALLGVVYLNQKLMGMAKVSFQQALKLNPREPLALANIAKCTNAPSNSTNLDKTKKGSGFFGWLGGS
ncbi:J domain-containing protein [Pseudanabaena sp. PCC 6802]|uniref:J domain-containing protein n=1 Tax=Pseudanabaena sp. PCC 6802 TaxID=118173 RepID=UPI00034635AA|nr:DnaJ domain-containing protein [Pseudanabaena sp. PCC 6802]